MPGRMPACVTWVRTKSTKTSRSITSDRLTFLGIARPRRQFYSDTFDISAFGVTQRFVGRVDRVYADMGDGNDTIKVIDPAGHTLYSLHGGSGDDTIDIDGSVDFAIYGEAGKDTIDAGYGTVTGFHNRIDGGPDADTITFGDGNLQRMIPGSEMYVVRAPDDFSTDRIIIDNTRARNRYFYDFFRDLGPYDETIRIDDDSSEPSRWIYTSKYRRGNAVFGQRRRFVHAASPRNLRGCTATEATITSVWVMDLTLSCPMEPVIFVLSTLYYNGGSGEHDSITLGDTATRTPRSYQIGVSPVQGLVDVT